MSIIIDLVLLLIVALCIWNGYKSGLIGGFAGILAIIIALLAGSMLSSNYAYEAIPVLEPFVDGYIDSQKTRDEVMAEMGYGSTDLSLEDQRLVKGKQVRRRDGTGKKQVQQKYARHSENDDHHQAGDIKPAHFLLQTAQKPLHGDPPFRFSC